jgi:hypothetical protein
MSDVTKVLESLKQQEKHILARARAEVQKIRKAIRALEGLNRSVSEKPKRRISAATRKRMAAAQKRRWAEQKKTG